MDLTALPAVSAPLPWQSENWSRLGRQFQEGTLPHALIIAGPPATGKARLALALARLLLCQAPSGGLNCGTCHACELSASGSHGDLRWLQPEEKSRNIKIDQIRDAVAFATKTAGFGERKVLALAPADSMNTNAANALLKSLEEPSPGTYLLLVCDQLHAVPATIRSRCQIIRQAAPAAEAALQWLDQLTGDRDESGRLFALADGMPLLAEALYNNPDAGQVVQARLACAGLAAGKIGVGEAKGLLADTEATAVLEQVSNALRQHLKQLDRAALCAQQARAAFELLDEISGLQRAVLAGANPNRQLLTEVLLEKLHSVLGGVSASGNIRH
ncbi:DNA polymerase III subunit delta' [Pseudohalioglobus sediminis]|uniref:DNA-directed DNA polymerase n=1 Tax=Pseudohalioglobus sediminis TaxID=2606449 RepID=A0A5B0X1J2_9GAMM|nr:DNA polymerase III subunit delta' [Pseudohalioglobus sediminis]KAA1193146.1 DNA polymerase III subunit delta' [Pseudohalioglobus sediminis]